MLCFLLLAIAQNCTGDMGPNASTLALAKEAIFEFKLLSLSKRGRWKTFPVKIELPLDK